MDIVRDVGGVELGGCGEILGKDEIVVVFFRDGCVERFPGGGACECAGLDCFGELTRACVRFWFVGRFFGSKLDDFCRFVVDDLVKLDDHG